MFELNWASFEPNQGVLQLLLPGHHEVRTGVIPGRREARHPGPGPGRTRRRGCSAWPTAATWTRMAHVSPRPTSCSARRSAPPPRSTCPWSPPASRCRTLGHPAHLRRERRDALPRRGTYWAFDNAALTGNGLPAGMTRNPYPNWQPGTGGLTQAQISTWVNWYIGGLDNVTNWQMQTLSGLGFTGYYETVTPGSGTRPDYLAQAEQQNLQRRHHRRRRGLEPVLRPALQQDQRHRLYLLRRRPVRRQRLLPASDTSLSLTSNTMDSWSSTRWISRIAVARQSAGRRRESRLRAARQPGLLLHQHHLHRHDG